MKGPKTSLIIFKDLSEMQKMQKIRMKNIMLSLMYAFLKIGICLYIQKKQNLHKWNLDTESIQKLYSFEQQTC